MAGVGAPAGQLHNGVSRVAYFDRLRPEMFMTSSFEPARAGPHARQDTVAARAML